MGSMEKYWNNSVACIDKCATFIWLVKLAVATIKKKKNYLVENTQIILLWSSLLSPPSPPPPPHLPQPLPPLSKETYCQKQYKTSDKTVQCLKELEKEVHEVRSQKGIS